MLVCAIKYLKKRTFIKRKGYLLGVIGSKVIQSAKIKSRLKRIAPVNSLKIKEEVKKIDF